MKTINREAEAKLSHEYLVSILDYNPETGVFIRKVQTSRCIRIGDIAGSLHPRGYLSIWINNHAFHAHRLAWFYFYKEWPKGIIDHIDRNPSNNAITNLRDVDQSINNHNKRIQNNNTSGYVGVGYDNKMRRWVARITIEGKSIHLGCFMDKEFAIKARKEAEKQYAIKRGYRVNGK